LVKSKTPTESWFGGLPKVGNEFSWPLANSKPLGFIAQIRLADIPKIETTIPLPATGVLTFFADFFEDWKVVYEPSEENLTDAIAPAIPAPDPVTGWRKLLPAKKPRPRDGPVFKQKFVTFQVIDSYPGLEADEIDDLEEEDYEELAEYTKSLYPSDCAHHLFGYAEPQQGEGMELQCQLDSNGLTYGLKSTEADPRYKSLAAGAKDWKLLLQVDSDGDTGFMWGDAGMLYFWIRQEDAATLSFDRVWMTSQWG
jgi:uncharacterized protein YwqG